MDLIYQSNSISWVINMNIIAYGFALLISLIMPILISIFLIVRSKTYFKPIIVGVITFLIFQVFTRIYIIQVILPTQVWYILFTYQYPVLYAFLLSLTAGLFEEIGRYIMMKFILKKMELKHALAFGIGHGGIEAMLFVGLELIMVNPATIDTQNLMMSGLERLSAMIFHCGFSVLVYQMVFKGKKYHLILSITLHTLVNFISVILMMNGVNLWILEGLLLMFALIMLYFIKTQWRYEYETNITHS